MKSYDIRKTFLDYFERHGHTRVQPGPLVPTNDKTLLFTNAGMVQFKAFFLGQETPRYLTATSCQPCIRAGGKHNDLENVGYTARHHTLFEMLGNFSFGEYNKSQAIHYAWILLTQGFKLPPEKLWVTVFEEDDEAEAIWRNEIGVSAARITRCGEADNFWRMGDVGPCGPCSEIFYDHGPEVPGGPPGSETADGDRYVEIWNLVFMQYEQRQAGERRPLKQLCVDTGMGLERIAAVLQGVHNNYDTDLFLPIIRAAAALAGYTDLSHHSLRVIADHMRSTLFLMAEGVFPSNEGRGYVLRRIIRRALRHSYQLGLGSPVLYQLVDPVIKSFAKAYPLLLQQQAIMVDALKAEERQFATTLNQGMRLLEQVLQQKVSSSQKVIAGELAFKLYDTYGFPLDLTADIAREHHYTVDRMGFEHCMAQQRKLSAAHSQFKRPANHSLIQSIDMDSKFIGYEQLACAATIIGLFDSQGEPVSKLTPAHSGMVVLDVTPFYPEGGGQIGDSGVLQGEDGALFYVEDTQKYNRAILHDGGLSRGELKIGQSVKASVDQPLRQATVLNHTATHLLHAALRQILGNHVKQKGSLVEPGYLRFDFTHRNAMTQQEIVRVEALVNDHIRQNHQAKIEQIALQQAIDEGALALFDEKYSDKQAVRVLTLSDFSKELCGGTHAERTGDLGIFKITSESAVASGVRRIEGVTGEGALNWVAKQSQAQNDEIDRLKAQLKTSAKQFEALQQQLHQQLAMTLVNNRKKMNTINFISSIVKNSNAKLLRIVLDAIKSGLEHYVVILATIEPNGRVSLLVGVDPALVSQVKANELASEIARRIGGKAGGRPDMAQGGGTQPERLSEALHWAQQCVSDHCN